MTEIMDKKISRDGKNMIKTGLPSHMRIAALQCDFEGGKEQTLKMPGKWKDLGFNVEQLFHTHAELYNAVYEGEKHEEMLSRYLAETRQNGIMIILYLNCHILLPSQEKMIEQWAKQREDGTYIKLYNNVYYSPCMNSSWTDYFLGQIEQLGDFDIGGVFFDGPLVHDCYCPSCRKLFAEKFGKAMTDAPLSEIKDFSNKQCIEFAEKIYRKVKEVNKNWISYTNSNLLHGNWSSAEIHQLLQCEDIVGTEGGFQFYGKPKDVPLWKCSLAAKMIEAVGKSKPKVIFMAGDHKSWSWYMHTAAETKLCYASILANGASTWYGIHCSSDMLESEAGEAAHEMLTFDADNDELYRDTESLAETAIFFSFDTGKKYPAEYQLSDFYGASSAVAADCIGSYSAGLDGAIAMLFRSGIPYDIVNEENLDSLAKYKTLVIPNAACLNAVSVAALREYVKQGGILIADGETSLYDENLNRHENFSLAEVFGLDFGGKVLDFNLWDYFRLNEDNIDILSDKGVKYIPAPVKVMQTRLHKNTEIIAQLCPPLSGCYAGKPEKPELPLITGHDFGKGRAYFIAGTFFELYCSYGFVHYMEIIRSLIKRGHTQPVDFISPSDAVEITYRKNVRSGKELIHLVNFTGSMSRPINKVIPLVDGELIINKPFKTATALLAGKKLRKTQSGSLIIPEIQEFEVIELEI